MGMVMPIISQLFYNSLVFYTPQVRDRRLDPVAVLEIPKTGKDKMRPRVKRKILKRCHHNNKPMKCLRTMMSSNPLQNLKTTLLFLSRQT
jgi:hypothetical protein